MPLRYLPNAERCYFKKGEYLIQQNEKLEFLYYLIDGKVHRTLLLPNGKEILLNIKRAENENNYLESLIGVIILYDKFEQYGISNCSFVAHSDCICYRIPIDSYRIFETQHTEEVLTQLLSCVMDNYQELLETHSSMFHKNAIALLCSHILKYSTTLNDRTIYKKDITKVEISKLLGVHPVNISKIFSTLLKENILEDNRTHYTILDKAYLESIASGEIDLRYANA